MKWMNNELKHVFEHCFKQYCHRWQYDLIFICGCKSLLHTSGFVETNFSHFPLAYELIYSQWPGNCDSERCCKKPQI